MGALVRLGVPCQFCADFLTTGVVVDPEHPDGTRRKADLFLPQGLTLRGSQEHAVPIYLDVKIVNSACDSYRHHHPDKVLYGVTRAKEEFWRRLYDPHLVASASERGTSAIKAEFVPFVVDVTGTWGEEAKDFMFRAADLAASHGDLDMDVPGVYKTPEALFKANLRRQVAFTLQKHNAGMIIRTSRFAAVAGSRPPPPSPPPPRSRSRSRSRPRAAAAAAAAAVPSAPPPTARGLLCASGNSLPPPPSAPSLH